MTETDVFLIHLMWPTENILIGSFRMVRMWTTWHLLSRVMWAHVQTWLVEHGCIYRRRRCTGRNEVRTLCSFTFKLTDTLWKHNAIHQKSMCNILSFLVNACHFCFSYIGCKMILEVKVIWSYKNNSCTSQPLPYWKTVRLKFHLPHESKKKVYGAFQICLEIHRRLLLL